MNKKIFYLFSAALLIGGLTGCSSSDDVGSEANQVNPTRIGEALDDITSQMQSSIFNCNQAKSRTRAQSNIDAIIKDIPTWPKDLDTTVPGNAKNVQTNSQIWVAGGPWYVAKGESYTLTSNFNLTNTTMYVSGTLTLESSWTDAYKTRIIVKDGGTLIVKTNGSNILGSGGSIYVEKGGTLTVPDGATLNVDQNSKVYVEDGNISAKRIIVQGTLYVNGDLKAESFGDMIANSTRLYVTGKLTSTDADLKTDGYIRVGGDIDAGNHAIYFQNTTHLIAECGIKANLVEVNSNNAEIHVNYIKCNNFNQCATSKVYLNDKGFIDVAGTYNNQNNGNDAAIIMEGKNAMGVIKAGKIRFNGSGSPTTLNKAYFIQTSDGQKAGVDCNTFNYASGGDVDFTKINFNDNTVEHISEGKVLDANGNKVSDEVKYSIPADGCHGNGYVPSKPGTPDTPDTPDTPENPQPYVVSESHTHDISATCVQTDGKNVYVSYHKRGNGRSGCLEMLSTTGDVTTLKQFVRDHDNAIDFNHITLDKSDKRLYAVGNNKNGGFLGYVRLTDDGKIDCTSQDMKGLDSTEIARKTYEPLQLVKLYQAQRSANTTHSKDGGDGNCVIVNGDNLQVASTYGYEIFDKDLNPVGYKQTAGRAKHLCFSPDGNNVFAIHYDGTLIENENTEVGLVLDKFNASDATMQNPVLTVAANKVKPNNGKNAMCVYDGKVYVCQSMNGLYVYDANTGTKLGEYKENIWSDNLQKDLAICANGVAVDANYVYIAYGTRGLVVLDRNTLKKVSSFVSMRSANYVTLANGYIYVAYGRNCLKVFKLM